MSAAVITALKINNSYMKHGISRKTPTTGQLICEFLVVRFQAKDSSSYRICD